MGRDLLASVAIGVLIGRGSHLSVTVTSTIWFLGGDQDILPRRAIASDRRIVPVKKVKRGG
jgi:hypothetical protein